ncbi:MAG: cobalt ECF transporter T component CbiQ [Acidimicrobiales bacterium]
MSGRHLATGLHGPRDTAIHALDPAVKIACLVGFLFAVVATPPSALAAFGLYALLVAAAAALARIPLPVLLRRLTIEVPFLLFAAALPLIGSGPHREVLGVTVSEPGLWAAWSIVAKATLGTAATVVLAWSTPVADLLMGLDRLHVPRALTAIAGFMVRYLDVVAGELRRLQIARVSRGDDPRWIWQARAVASTAGATFIRSFERGERVHHAMLARGFTGSFPTTTTASHGSEVTRGERPRTGWFPALVWPATAWAIALTSLVVR